MKLCAAAGLVRLGLVALDDTKVAANAAYRANRTLAKPEEEVTQILREAAATDQAEGLAVNPPAISPDSCGHSSLFSQPGITRSPSRDDGRSR